MKFIIITWLLSAFIAPISILPFHCVDAKDVSLPVKYLRELKSSKKSKKSSSKSSKSSKGKYWKDSHKYGDCPIAWDDWDEWDSSSSSKSSKSSKSKSKKSKSKKSKSKKSKSSKSSSYKDIKRTTIEFEFVTETILIGDMKREMSKSEMKKFSCVVRKHLQEEYVDLCPFADPQVLDWDVLSQDFAIYEDDETNDFVEDFGGRRLQVSRLSTTNSGSGTYRGPPPLDGKEIVERAVKSSAGRRRQLKKKLPSSELIDRLRETDSYFDSVQLIQTVVILYEETDTGKKKKLQDLPDKECTKRAKLQDDFFSYIY